MFRALTPFSDTQLYTGSADLQHHVTKPTAHRNYRVLASLSAKVSGRRRPSDRVGRRMAVAVRSAIECLELLVESDQVRTRRRQFG